MPRPGCILVVDDTPESLGFMERLLGAEGYRVLVATEGRSALARAAQVGPDLILLDVMMPGMDGFEVCRRLKADPATRDIPVIFLTSLGEASDQTRGFEAGAVDFVCKPFQPLVLQARVRTHLALAQARRELEARNRELLEAARIREEVERITQHDLKSPLTAIMSGAELICRSTREGEPPRRMAEVIQGAARRMLHLIHMSLDLFRIEQGTYHPTLHPLDLEALLRETIRGLAPSSPGVRIRLRHEDGEAPILVQGEETLCHALFENLVKNALEASTQDQEVQVRLRSGPFVEVEIHNAQEIPEAIRGRFFEKFATFGKPSGTGLGAYSARMMARVMGGEVLLLEHGPGTTLRVSLPHAASAAGESRQDAALAL